MYELREKFDPKYRTLAGKLREEENRKADEELQEKIRKADEELQVLKKVAKRLLSFWSEYNS